LQFKWELLSKVIDKIETRGTRKALARNKMAVAEVNKRLELRKFLKIDGEVKLKSVYNFTSKFESEQ